MMKYGKQCNSKAAVFIFMKYRFLGNVFFWCGIFDGYFVLLVGVSFLMIVQDDFLSR